MSKKIGDRRDAIKVRNVDGVHKIMVCLKPLRCDSDVYINEKIDVTDLVRFIKEKKKNDSTYTFFHAFSMALGKLVYNRPLLNRYVINRKFYDRRNISIGFVAKVAFEDHAKENLSVVTLDNKDTIENVKNKFLEKVNSVRGDKDNSTDATATLIGKLPQWLVNIVVWVLKKFDNFDILPHSITDDSIYHCSILVSNLGSIKCGAIYHNLTDFGTNSILVTIGEIRKETIVNDKGKSEIRDICEFGVTCDERIADGFYFAKSILLFKHIISNPKLLDEPLEEKIEYET